jgi:excinuclease UvrABC nuclease subunit
MTTQDHISQAVADLLTRIKDCKVPSIAWFPIKEAKTRSTLKEKNWANSTGVYFFLNNRELRYVGRALDSTLLINRILEQATAYGDPDWDKVIQDDSTIVGALPLVDENAVWIPSLEVYLINKYMPQFNKRR